MDLRTGRTYPTREAAIADGVPASDVAEVFTGADGSPDVRFGPVISGTGPFKGRFYRRDLQKGGLVRVGRDGRPLR